MYSIVRRVPALLIVVTESWDPEKDDAEEYADAGDATRSKLVASAKKDFIVVIFKNEYCFIYMKT
jgi:hypothetical protein